MTTQSLALMGVLLLCIPIPISTMPTPVTEPTEMPAFGQMDRAVDSNCPAAKRMLADAERFDNVAAWSTYVHILIRCGERQKGLTQAKIYAEAISMILESILYERPDAYGSASWRATARTLISKALPESTTDRELVDEFKFLRSELASDENRASTNVDRKPMASSVSASTLVPRPANGIGIHTGHSWKEIWFTIPPAGTAPAEQVVRKRLVSMGWYICPPENPKSWHDQIVFVDSSKGRAPRLADSSFSASLRNEWDLSALFYAEAPSGTRVVFRVREVDFKPLCVRPKTRPLHAS